MIKGTLTLAQIPGPTQNELLTVVAGLGALLGLVFLLLSAIEKGRSVFGRGKSMECPNYTCPGLIELRVKVDELTRSLGEMREVMSSQAVQRDRDLDKIYDTIKGVDSKVVRLLGFLEGQEDQKKT